MTLTNKLANIGRMYAAITQKAYHYKRPGNVTAPWLVWAEDSGEELIAGNRVAEQAIGGTTDYYTLDEFDETIDNIQTAQNTLEGFVWGLNSVQYEEETNLIHYEWTWRSLG